jgi:hypothetical protein
LAISSNARIIRPMNALFLTPARWLLLLWSASCALAQAQVQLDEAALGQSLGGWDVKRGKAADYQLSGSKYRTYKPEITPTPEGGIFVSVRIDYCRGMFASNDFATLEMTFDARGMLTSTQSSIAIQGRKITSDVMRTSVKLGENQGAVGAAVKMGGDLVADLTEKLTRENLVEAGRVTFPAAVRHNFNKVFQAVSYTPPVQAPMLPESEPAKPGAAPEVKK